MATEFTGIIERCDLSSRDPFQPDYYSQAERKEFFLDVCLRLDDGSRVYFKTPAATRRVSSCPGAAVVIHRIEGEAVNWMEEYVIGGGERRAVATADSPNSNDIRPKVRVGNRITVSGRIKANKISKAGKPYKTINYVRLLETS